jgi:hypothetical protein
MGRTAVEQAVRSRLPLLFLRRLARMFLLHLSCYPQLSRAFFERPGGKLDIILNYVFEHLFCDFASDLPLGLYPAHAGIIHSTHAGKIRTTDAQDGTDSPMTGQKIRSILPICVLA